MVKVAHVGCGYWGKNLVRNFSELGALAAVVDGHGPTRDAMAKTYGVAGRELADVLDDPAIDAVSIATPAETHAQIALAALARGKHVYVEKPLALTLADCDAMIAAAEKAGRVLMVGHLLQYHPIFVAFAQKVREGLIGELRYVYSNRMSLGKFRTEENALWSLAPHDISMVLRLTGASPTVVTAQGAAYVTPGLADWATVQMVFPGGVRGHVQVSWLHPFKEQRLVAVGSDGMLVFEDSEPDWARKLVHYAHRVDLSGRAPEPVKADAAYLEVARGEPLKAECRHFIDCAANGTQPTTDGREGRAVLDVLSRAEAALAHSLAEA